MLFVGPGVVPPPAAAAASTHPDPDMDDDAGDAGGNDDDRRRIHTAAQAMTTACSRLESGDITAATWVLWLRAAMEFVEGPPAPPPPCSPAGADMAERHLETFQDDPNI